MELKKHEISITRSHSSGLYIIYKTENLTILVMKKRASSMYIGRPGEAKAIHRNGKTWKPEVEKAFLMTELPGHIINTLVHFITEPTQKWKICFAYMVKLIRDVGISENIILHVNMCKNELHGKCIKFSNTSEDSNCKNNFQYIAKNSKVSV